MKTKIYPFVLGIFVLLSSLTIIAQEQKPIESTTATYSAVVVVGTEFKYQVTVKTMLAVMPTSYKLVTSPTGMTIDEKTGLIKWTPTAKGEYSAEAQAFLNTTKLGSVILKLKVVDIIGSVTGTVISSGDNKPLQFAFITLYKKVVVTGKADTYTATYSGSTDASGNYKIPNVELGAYILSAYAKSTEASTLYQQVYYPNAAKIEDATPITVKDATPVVANFTLQKVVIPTTVIVEYAAKIKVAAEFKYQVNVKLPDGVTTATYRLTARPEGMLINETTGLVTWTPKTKGDFSAQVTVIAKDFKIALVNMKLTVYSLEGSISGTVTDPDKKPLQNILVMLYRKVSTTEKSPGYVGSTSVLTGADGKYTISNVDEGSYYIYARQSSEKSLTPVTTIYLPMYYNNVETIDKATAVPVTAAAPNVSSIDFQLKKYVKAEPVKAALSGTVTDAGGKAIAGAKILISQTKTAVTSGLVLENLNFQISNAASSVNCYADVLSDIKTDANGKYSISLPVNSNYIVNCSAEGFIQQFYNGKTSVLDANKIFLRRDTTGIDFKLAAVPVAKATISGVVVDSAKLPVVSKVVLYSLNSTTNNIDKGIRSVATNDKGQFVFEKIPNGKYYLQVIPLKDYLPAYYKLNDCGVREPRQSDIITIANDANVSGLSVCVKKVKLTGGGKISGFIRNMNGEPVGGVVIIAESSDQGDQSFDISDSDGSYNIENLGVGVYSVYTDKAGFATSFTNNAVIDYTKNAFGSQVDLIVDAYTITDIKRINSIPTKFELMQNYPNPFNPSTVISWQIIEASHVTLKVFDMLGREVATLVDEFKQPGVYNSQFTIQHSQLSSGVYYYTLQAGNLLQTKKMMLVK